ncbi:MULTISPECIES: hypothetical protein [Gallibacterium]|uniref:Uncharacterized protein n=2 Tax=Gallibacterium TaxID=155493 RepID=A0A1A7Q0C3_9PAST|nr:MULTISPECIES: hypothetical protein [Gallibacterium]OBW98249.1 hypothetical protein QV03_07630 [Gallibacterium anatis]OBX07392.1 hypothetical protein QV07_07175 [Gallibacterium genomosp. 3]
MEENSKKSNEGSLSVIVLEFSKNTLLSSLGESAEKARDSLLKSLQDSPEIEKLLVQPMSAKLFVIENAAKYGEPIYKIAISVQSKDANKIAKVTAEQLASLQGGMLGASLAQGLISLLPISRMPIVSIPTKFIAGTLGGYAGSQAGEKLVDLLWDLDKDNNVIAYRSDSLNITIFEDGNNVDIDTFSSNNIKFSDNTTKFLPAPFYGTNWF